MIRILTHLTKRSDFIMSIVVCTFVKHMFTINIHSIDDLVKLSANPINSRGTEEQRGREGPRAPDSQQCEYITHKTQSDRSDFYSME